MTAADRAAYAIAERLGITVREVVEHMTCAEYLGWIALPQIDKQNEREANLSKLFSRVSNGQSR
tara:strand:- start:17 stop:208 length:192 start_codon:yes stop_codon:yes gene_type:complete